jgi:NADH-quinone oxidoreductase subunit D
MTVAPEKTARSMRDWPIVFPPPYEGSRIPKRVPTILDVPPELLGSDDILRINFGPNHPSTHGVLRLILDLNGEQVVGLNAVIGYLHTGFEKTMEQKTWWKCVTYPERIDYVGYQNAELVFVLAVEQLLSLEVPEKATWMRTLLCELNRIHSHLVFLGTSALELGAISMFWYCFRERETILDLYEMVTGARMHTRYFQVGGLAEDIPDGFYDECRTFVEWMPRALDDYLALLDRNAIWLERTKGVGKLSADDAIALGQSGPNLRASGVDWDLRRDQPYLAYGQVDFRVPVYAGGDVYDRYRVRMDEMAESTRIVDQCLRRLERLQGRPWIADDRKVVLPPREELHTSMESLIHHFKLVTEGFRVPEGEIYVAVESPRGESGCYLVSDGGPKPWRVHFRAPSFAALEATATCTYDALIADLIAIVGSLDAVMGDTDR